MGTKIGIKKLCPIMTDEADTHCQDDCEWNDGDGCAIWRIVKALEKIATAQAPMQKR